MRFALWMVWVAWLVAGCSTQAPVRVSPVRLSPGYQVPQATDLRLPSGSAMRYWLYLPAEYEAEPGRRWPLVLFLHGAGERGTNLAAVAVHGPPKLVAGGRQFPFILVSPQCPAGERWQAEKLVALLDHLDSRLRVDPHRRYVTGLSMGGYGTWELATRYPERLAAVAPICGGGQTIDLLLGNKPAAKTLGVWAFHGAKDTLVVPAESERMIEAFRRAGNEKARLTVYPEAGHDSWTETYRDEGFYRWLLEQSR